MSKTPTISIILPTHNGSQYIEDAIKSVLNQSFKDFELIIINDGSTDITKELIQKLSVRDERLVYFENRKNLGLIKSLNKGLASSKGLYIARIDDDDEWTDKNKLKKQLNSFKKHHGLGMVGTNAKIVDKNGFYLRNTNHNLSDEKIRKNLLLNNQFIHSSVMIRKDVIKKIGMYRDDLKAQFVEDYELWLRIATKYKVLNLKDVSVLYRRNDEGVSFNKFNRQKINGFKIVLEHLDDFPNGKLSVVLRSIRLLIPRQISLKLQNI